MGTKKDISPEKISEIKALLNHTTKSVREIASISGVSKSLVSKLKVKMHKKQPLTANQVGKCGRNRVTTARTDRKIRDICIANRFQSAARLTTIANNDGINISKRTVQRRLAEADLFSHRPAVKPRLTNTMKRKRFQWAKTYQRWTITDWNKVKF